MKKRTKKKIGKFFTGVFKFLLKLIFIYPFTTLWWVLKHSYIALKEVASGSTSSKKKKGSLVQKESKKTIKSETKELHTTKKGKTKSEPQHDPLVEIQQKRGNFNKFQEKLYTNKSTIGLILGARGTGKSAIGMRILENFKTQSDKNIYCMGFKAAAIPHWMTVVSRVDDIENGSILLIDEGGIEFSSRKSMSDANMFLSDILLVARHKDLSVLFITQNSANLEINVIRQADYLVMKSSSLLQKDFERTKIKKIYESVEQDFEEMKDVEGLTYIYADNYHGFVTNTLPSFWSEQASKGYSGK
jgi:hypothetical protein